MQMSELHEQSKAETATPPVKMLMALQLRHGRNPRVLAGTAMPDAIFSGLDLDLDPAHRAARQGKRRNKRNAARRARAVHAKASK